MKLIIGVAALVGVLASGCAPRETFHGAGGDSGSGWGDGPASPVGSTGSGAVPQAAPEQPGLGPTDLGPFEDSPGSSDFILPRNRNTSLEI